MDWRLVLDWCIAKGALGLSIIIFCTPCEVRLDINGQAETLIGFLGFQYQVLEGNVRLTSLTSNKQNVVRGRLNSCTQESSNPSSI
jgi:hypothetical protein